jgi:predicted nucleic-acid-binding Zn-ribbon protein
MGRKRKARHAGVGTPAGSWVCGVCEHSNLQSWKACRTCRCPADATEAQIKTLRADYDDSPMQSRPYQALQENYDPKPGDRKRKKKPYACAKCRYRAARVGEIVVSGGSMSALFDMQTQRFTYVACGKCGFTEFYYGHIDVVTGTLDLLIT